MSVFSLITALCLAEILSMLGMFTFAALLPNFIRDWHLTNTEAGWLSSVFLGGYAVSVPILVSLTDRIDPRRLYLASAFLGAVASLGFALLAQGFWSAFLLRTLLGVSLAGTYMPGLKALSDRIEGPQQPRAVAFYTSSFGIGTASSFFFAGLIDTWLNWQWAFGVGALGSAAALVIVARVLSPTEPQDLEVPTTALLDFRPVLRNRSSLAYILCYAVHNWELFGQRSWVVALLVFTQARHDTDVFLLTPTVIATLMTLLGVCASITGNELAMRVGRRRLIFTTMLFSAILCGLVGFSSSFSYGLLTILCLFHGMTASGESAAVTAGAIGTATRGYRGTTMALHSTVGFSFAFMGPLALGWILDLAGGEGVLAWGLAFALMGVVMILGALALALLRPHELPGDRRN